MTQPENIITGRQAIIGLLGITGQYFPLLILPLQLIFIYHVLRVGIGKAGKMKGKFLFDRPYGKAAFLPAFHQIVQFIRRNVRNQQRILFFLRLVD